MKKLPGKVDLRNNYAVYEENGAYTIVSESPRDLHGNPLRGVGVQARVHDLVPPDDHDFLKKVGHNLGPLLGARHDQLVVGEVVLVIASRQLL